jgi:hypothetical protein
MIDQSLVLMKIFSYNCMNCIRSLRYTKKLDNKYKKFGLITKIIYVPEWKFELNNDRLKNSSKYYTPGFNNLFDLKKIIIKKLGINFWPALILKKGKRIIYKNVGEGNYKKIEKVIRGSLGIQNGLIFLKEPKFSRYPAVYAGKEKKGHISRIQRVIKFGTIYHEGNWIQRKEFIEGRGIITFLSKGKKVFMVAESSDNYPIYIKTPHKDKSERQVIKEPKLYEIFRSKDNKGKIIRISSKNRLKIYSFAFQ